MLQFYPKASFPMAYLRTLPNTSLNYKLPIFPFLRIFNSSPSSISATQQTSPLAGVEDAMMGYIVGNKKSTQLAHSSISCPSPTNAFLGRVWSHIVQKGDTVIDATCGNGNDTLAMLRMVSDSTSRGRVYAMDVQPVALKKTSELLDQHVTPKEKELVELFPMCHSNLEDIIPDGIRIPVRLVAFNLGYLPGGDKMVTTRSETTRLALEASERILAPGGLISIMVYIGHSGGREEFETVQAFASGLHAESWSCCKFEMLNRPLAPILVLLVKR